MKQFEISYELGDWTFKIDTKFKITRIFCDLIQNIIGVEHIEQMSQYALRIKIAKLFDLAESYNKIQETVEEFIKNPPTEPEISIGIKVLEIDNSNIPEELREIIENITEKFQLVGGPIFKNLKPIIENKSLEEQLDDAEKNQNFEEAAKLRDEIKNKKNNL